MLFVTQDGSHSLFSARIGEAYHSRHGAIQESLHVFIEKGLKPKMARQNRIKILEIGLGTGLNALLTLLEADKASTHIDYHAIEAYPITIDQARSLNYLQLLDVPDYASHFLQMHLSPWEVPVQYTEHFSLHKHACQIEDFAAEESFDLIYFDAFAPQAQPELWTLEIFQKMYGLCRKEAILVTYCAKGDVRRDMLKAGFSVEKVPGPPGKREMLRAIRT